MKQVLVGGVGFVGANLVAELRKRHEVLVVARPSSIKKRPRIAEDIRRMGADILLLDSITPEALARVGGDAYHHVAGVLAGSREALEEAHVNLLRRVISAASQVKARVVYVSSTGVSTEIRGVPPGSKVSEEERHLDPATFVHRTPYEITKAEGERLLVSSDEALGGRWAILRPSVIFGPWGYEPQWRATLWAARRGLTLFTGSRNAVYAGDVARVAEMASSGSLDRSWVYVNWPFEVDIGDIGMEICRQMGRRCRRLSLRWAARLAYLAPSSSLKLLYRTLKYNYFYVSRRLEGFSYTSLQEAVSRFLEWASGGTSA
ncbi:MAG: NAD(P)-dependent oxidoreductase [Acidilobus sp.]